VNNLREIQVLRRLSPHPNIIHLEDIIYDQTSGGLGMVFELMDKNLYDLISGRRDHLDSSLIASLARQLFTALDHMHNYNIFHRDIKPENILVDKSAMVLKLADFGSCRGTHSKQPFTGYIATRWYRAPECLLTDGCYGPEMDIWAAGSVLFELISLYPLFPGSDDLDQLARIHKVLGTPLHVVLMKLDLKSFLRSDLHFQPQKGIGIRHFIPHASSTSVNFIYKTLKYDYSNRITAKEALKHAYIDDLQNPPKVISEMDKTNKKAKIEKTNRKGVACAVKTQKKPLESPLRKIPKRAGGSNHMKASEKIVRPRKNSKAKDGTGVSKPNQKRKPAAAITKSPPPVYSKNKNSAVTSKKHKAISHTRRVTKRRTKFFSNVASSGYGSSSYQPTKGAASTTSTNNTSLSMTANSTSTEGSNTQRSKRSYQRKASDGSRSNLTLPCRSRIRPPQYVSPL